jgi:hypothetical protein
VTNPLLDKGVGVVLGLLRHTYGPPSQVWATSGLYRLPTHMPLQMAPMPMIHTASFAT